MTAPPLEHSPDDEAIVSEQIGRSPRGAWAVAARCHLGVPMVIENHPRLDDGAPFPTLFWLTCPLLVKHVSRLEGDGGMTVLNERLAADDGLRSRLEGAIERLRARRDEHQRIDDSGSPPGGDPDRVKCLHVHVAQELAQPPNPVGALALAGTGWPDCRLPCVSVEDGT